jgi:pimeloyl-ACP methyl ester carboxylesterase
LHFTPYHRGGGGTPLVFLHGFLDTWRSWELLLPALERSHDVLAPTLPGHAGGPPIEGELSDSTLADAVERCMDDAGFDTAHVVGNSLGGFVGLQLAARGRARSVVALAPAGGWSPGDGSLDRLLSLQAVGHQLSRQAAPYVDRLVATPEGRRRATELITVSYEHIPADLLALLTLAVAACDEAPRLIEYARRTPWTIEPERIACPVRVVWGTEDRLLPWPSAATRFRTEWLPHADWVVLDGVGHCPQLDVPLETAQLILGFTSG